MNSPLMEIFNLGPKNLETFSENVKKVENGPKSIFLEVEGLSKAKKVTLPPIFGVGEHEKTASEPRKHHFSGERADFWPPGVLFSAPGLSSAVGVENMAIWVKKSTSRLLVQKYVLKVGKAEKRVFMPF